MLASVKSMTNWPSEETGALSPTTALLRAWSSLYLSALHWATSAS